MNATYSHIRTATLPLLWFVALLIMQACQPRMNPAAEKEAILRATAGFSQALVNENYDALVACYTSDAVIFPSSFGVLDTPEAIRSYWTPNQKQAWKTVQHRIIPQKITFEGDRAIDHGYYKGVSSNGEKERAWFGKYLVIWKKTGSGWKMEYDAWNYVAEEHLPEEIRTASFDYDL